MPDPRNPWVSAQAAHFDRWITEHPEVYEGDAYWDWVRDQFVAYTLSFLPPDAVVLDVGCGDGYSAHRLAESPHVRCVTAIDVSPQSVSYAQRRYRSPKLTFTCTAIEEWETAERFDMVCCTEAIEHFADVEDALRIIAGLLTAGGLLCVRTPNRLRLENMVRRCAGFTPVLVDPMHSREFSIMELEEIGARYGFRTVSWRTYVAWGQWTFFPFFPFRRVRAIAAFLQSAIVQGKCRWNYRLGRLLGPFGAELQIIMSKRHDV